MPYLRDGKCVYKKNEDGSRGELVKCHDSEDAAQEHLAALVANVEDAKSAGEFRVAFGDAVKSLGNGRVGGYLVMYGSADQPDLEGEYFTKDTDFGLDWFDSRPVLYHHGLDKSLKGTRIGKIDTLKQDDIGVWVEAQLDLRNQYVSAIMQLVEKGVLGWSSGTLPQLVHTENGQIKVWPIVEGSNTPTPAEPRLSVVPLKSLLTIPQPEGLATAAQGNDEQDTGDATKAGEPPHDAEAPVTEAQADAAPPIQPDNLAGGKLQIAPPPADGPGRNPAPADAGDNSGDNLPMDAKHLVLLAINKTLEALKVSNVDEAEINTLAESVLQHAQQGQPEPQPGQNGTPPGAMAVDPDAIAKAAMDVVKNYLAERDVEQAVKKAATDAANKPASPVPTGVNTTPQAQVYTKYHDLDADDMAFLASIRQAMGKSIGTDQFARELADKALKKSDRYRFLEKDKDGQPQAIKALKMIQDGMKANELMHTTQTDFGLEWIPDLWSNQLWETVRFENRILSLMDVIDMPQDDYVLPVEDQDPTVYRVAETTDDSQFDPAASPVTMSKIGTDNVTLHAEKLGIRAGFSAEQDEDSIIRVLPHFRKKLLRAMEDAIEYDILHADNTIAVNPSGNINRYDAATQAADPDHWLLGFDGIAHLPLVDDTTLLVNQGGAAPDLTMMRALRRRLAPVFQSRLDDLVYVVEPVTGTALIDIDEVLTVDKFGAQATVKTGQLGALDSIPIVVSGQFLQSDNEDGKISNTANNNTFGRVLLFHKPSWRVGFRRRVKLEVVRFPLADASQLVAFCRLAMVRKDDDAAALAWNIGL